MESSRKVVTSFALRLVAVSLASALALAACSREQGDWRSAQAADTVESYHQFLTQHPESELTTQARARIQQLSEEQDWQKAATTDTLESYQEFLNRHPQSKWAGEARIRVENFAVAGSLPGAGGAGSGVEAPAPADSMANASSAEIEPSLSQPATKFGVQLGAFSSSDRANAEWQRIASQYPGPLEGLSPRVVAVEQGGKALYRLQANVMDEAQARAVCGALKQGGQGCVVVLP
jgi:TolA-binding protein